MKLLEKSSKSLSPPEINDEPKRVFERVSEKKKLFQGKTYQTFFQAQVINSIFLERKCFYEWCLVDNITPHLKSTSHFIFQHGRRNHTQIHHRCIFCPVPRVVTCLFFMFQCISEFNLWILSMVLWLRNTLAERHPLTKFVCFLQIFPNAFSCSWRKSLLYLTKNSVEVNSHLRE